VTEVWDATQRLCQQSSLLSAAATALQTRFAQSYMATLGLEGEEIHQAFSSVIKAGYASRAVLAGPTNQPSRDLSAFAPGSPAGVEQDSAAADELIQSVASIAFDDFGAIMTLPPEVWTAYVALAALRLQRSLASRTLNWRELSTDRIEAMLSFGYVLRCFDEALEGDSREPSRGAK
jgi:hypothetical protein